MSDSTHYNVAAWAHDKTPDEIRAEIARIEAGPEHRGAEFYDVRVRHQRQTRLAALRGILAVLTIRDTRMGV